MTKTKTKPDEKSNGKSSEEEKSQLFNPERAAEKLKRFLEKEGISIQPHFNCVNDEVVKEFQESTFVRLKLVSVAVRVVKRGSESG